MDQPASPAFADRSGPEDADDVIAIGDLPISAVAMPDLDEPGEPGDPLRPARGILVGAAMGLVFWVGILAMFLR